MIVHDLCSPLTVISGFAELLADETAGMSPAAQRYLQVISGKTLEVEHLVDNLLLASRIAGAGLPSSPVETPLAEVARHAVAALQPRAELARAEMSVVADGEVRAWADRDHTERIVTLLVTNALVHGGDAPRVEVGVAREGDGCVLRVRDQGPGVAEADRGRIFERYGGGSDGTSKKGTGLGLFLARRLAEDQQGSVELETSERGAVFALRLPAAQGAS